jgi:cytochrome c oxidase subunit 2
VDGSPATEGRKLFQKLQCITCHSGDALARGPLLEGLYGTRNRPLEGGGVVDVDEDYIRESILNPDARVAAGYKAIMPSFKGQVNEQEMIQLVAFIRSLRTARLPARTEETDPPPAVAPPTQPGAKSR